MGKHDRETLMDWSEDGNENFTEAENIKLKAENERLKTVVKALERDAARMERVYAKVVKGAKDAIETWKAENTSLKAQIERLEKALAREVVGKHV